MRHTMHGHYELIMTLTSGLAVALVLGYITYKLGLSPIVGYLLAGYLLGANSPGPYADEDIATQMAEIGVILLMFGVGLQFHIEELFKVRRVAIPGAIVQSTVATLLGCLVAHQVGWDWRAGLVFGLAISVASTVVLMRVLADNNDLHTPAGHIAVGWLVVEDIFTVLVLVLMPILLGPQESSASGIILALGWAVLKIGFLIGFTFIVGGRIIPWLLGHIAATRSRELFTLTVFVLALGIAVGAAKFFDASMALGAFLAGMVVGRSEFSVRAVSEALTLRDAFAVLFFVSVGMQFNPASLVEAPGVIATTLAIIMIGKPIAALALVMLLGYPLRFALIVAVALAQIGEFSFILASLGTTMGIFPELGTQALVAAAIISISLNPLIYKLNDRIENWARRRPKIWSMFGARLYEEDGGEKPQRRPESQYHAIVVGYGPVGKTVARLLRASQIEPTIIEMNIDTVRQLRSEGISAVYGDVTHAETLKEAGVTNATALIVSAADMTGTAELIKHARELNPRMRVFARTNYLRDLDDLREAGAHAVFSGEGEVALSMTEFMLRQLGATAEQVDRERDRIRRELFGDRSKDREHRKKLKRVVETPRNEPTELPKE